jgi:PAS domain S-box-containing protein
MAAKRKSSAGIARGHAMSNQLLRAFFDQSPDSIFVIDKKSRYVEVNPHGCKMLGYTRREMLSRSISDVVPAEDLERDPVAFDKMQRGGTVLKQRRMMRKDGKIVHAEVATRMLSKGKFIGIARDLTERAHTEQSLQERDAQLASIFRAAPVGIGMVVNRVIREVNESLCQMTGYSREELIGRSARMLYPSDEDFEFVGREKYRQIGDRGTGVVETRWKRKDGSIRHIILSSTPLHPEDLSRGVTFTALDITSRKQVEDSLREKEAELDRYFTDALDLLCIADSDGFFRRLNKEWESTLGYPIKELEGKRFLDFVHPDDVEATLQAIAQLDAQKQVLNFTNRYRSRDGSYRWIEWRSVPAGKLIYAAARDITESKHAEQALRESEERLRLTLDAANVVVWEGTLDGGFHEIGPVKKLFGKPEGPFHSTLADLNESIHPEDRGRIEEEIQRAFRGEKDYAVEFRVAHSDGNMHWIEAQGTLLRNEQGKPRRLLGIARDITERKRAVDVLRENMRRLQTVVTGAPIVLYSFDRNGVFTLSEGKGLVGLGIKPGEIVGRTVFDVYGDQPDAIAALRRALAGETFTVELSFAAGGTFEVSHTAIRDSAGNYAGTIGVLVDISERKRAEETVRNSEANLQLAFEAARLGDWMWNIVNGEVIWSARCKALYGLPADTEITYERFLERVHPEDRERVDLALRRAVEIRGEYEVEKRVIWPDGSMHWNSSRGRVFCDETGQPMRLVGVTLDITDRKRAEEALALLLQRHSLATQAARIGVWDWNIPNDNLVWDDKMYALYGITPNAFDGAYAAWISGVHPGDRAMCDEAIQKALRGEREYDIEFRVVWPNGSEHIIKAFGQVIRDLAGTPVRMTGVNYDITGQKRAEQALQESEAKFRAAFENAPIGMSMVQPDGTYLDVNPALCRMFGYSKEELLGGTINKVTHPDDVERGNQWIRKMILGDRSEPEFEKRYIHRDGHIVWGLVRAEWIKDESGKPLMSVVHVLDITERKRAEVALRESETRYRLLFESNPHPMWVYDLETLAFLTVNDAAVAAYGYSQDEFLSMTISDIRPQENSPRIVDNVANRTVVGGIDRSGVLRHRKKDQTLIDVEIISHPLAFKDRPAELVLANDITKRRKAEEKIRKLNEELESRVKERTLQLEEANKELEAFAYSVSHDLRAPLRAIDGYSLILLEDYQSSLDDEGRRVCNVVRTETQRMGQLVDDLLAFSRLSRSHKETTTIRMAALVNSVLNETISSESRSRIEFSVETMPDATGDPSLMRQVWSNLLSNAVKFSAKHPRPRIEVRGRMVGNEIEYSVRDNGAGFDMKYGAKLFGVFQRLHSSKEFEGTGVGLAIVQRIVHRHGGRVWAEGETDRGATFYFTLPVKGA